MNMNMKPSSSTTSRASKSRHRNSRLAQRGSSPFPTQAETVYTSPFASSVTPPAPSFQFESPSIPDDELESRMDHLLQKNYTSTDSLTLSKSKAKEFVSTVASAQTVVIDRAKRVDSVSNDGFADMEGRASSLFMTIPLQTKARKTAQITFLCKFLFYSKASTGSLIAPPEFIPWLCLLGLWTKWG